MFSFCLFLLSFFYNHCSFSLLSTKESRLAKGPSNNYNENTIKQAEGQYYHQDLLSNYL